MSLLRDDLPERPGLNPGRCALVRRGVLGHHAAPTPVRYCQFAKRFLDGFSWLAPLTNNKVGDALNIEFVHEHVFLIERRVARDGRTG